MTDPADSPATAGAPGEPPPTPGPSSVAASSPDPGPSPGAAGSEPGAAGLPPAAAGSASRAAGSASVAAGSPPAATGSASRAAGSPPAAAGHRRSYLIALAACLAGAGLTLYAVTRTWVRQVEHRPGLSDLRTEQTGADLRPWLIGLALVALAGAGALLATRGVARRGLGVVLTLTGAGIVVGALTGLTARDPGHLGPLWPLLTGLGGAILVLGGLTAARHGHRWPIMSSRYERRTAPAAAPPATATQPPSAAAGLKSGETPHSGALDTKDAWDALDRGDDPTLH